MVSKIWPGVHGVVSESEIQLERGVRQGSPEAGAMFLFGLEEAVGPLIEVWGGERVHPAGKSPSVSCFC